MSETDEVDTQAESLPNIVTILDTELGELREYKDKYLRLLADSENTRKRLHKEKGDAARFALQDFIMQFLYPIDNMENALAFASNMSDEVRNWAVGFQMILGQFKDALESQGVKPYHCKGDMFDPHRHEAVESEESSDVEEDTILEEFTRGYTMGDRVIRPARVKVAKAPKATEELKEEEKEEEKE